MVTKAAGKQIERKEKVQKARKEGRKLGALYIISAGKAERKNKFCPKCGPGMFMGRHSNRVVCGKCHYVEYVKRE
ncbi:MAG: 30S ribosomal protein S27ae [Nanoarchaeota archaeon]